MKIGLVLEGGGMRGLYTAGVIDIMLDHGFEPDVVCGTSAGVTFGVNIRTYIVPLRCATITIIVALSRFYN
jgi:predicted patatin/cPLA2 family phospholipase